MRFDGVLVLMTSFSLFDIFLRFFIKGFFTPFRTEVVGLPLII